MSMETKQTVICDGCGARVEGLFLVVQHREARDGNINWPSGIYPDKHACSVACVGKIAVAGIKKVPTSSEGVTVEANHEIRWNPSR